MAKKYTFKVGDSIYDIPEDRVDAFRKSKPDAIEVESYVVGKDTFDIPLDLVSKFKEKKPEAKPLYEAEAEKKKDIQSKPKQEAGAGFGAGLDRQYLDHFVTATDNVAKKFKWKDTADEDAYFNVLKKNNKFSDEQIGYIRKQYDEKKKEWTAGVGRLGKKEIPAIEKPGIVIQKRDSTATAAEAKKEVQDKYSEYRKKVRDEGVDYYMQNPDKFGDNFVAGYEAYLQEKMPAEYQRIKQKKETGRWDIGADPTTKIFYENLGRVTGIPGMGAAYEVAATIMGEKGNDDSARLYSEALNWKSEIEREAYDRISKSPIFKQVTDLNYQRAEIFSTPVGTQLINTDKAIKELQKQPDLQEFFRLSDKGAANNNTLEGNDWTRYQELKKAPSVAKYEAVIKERQAAMNTPEGQRLAKFDKQIEAIQQTPQYQQIAGAMQLIQQNAAKTEAQVKAYADKYPSQALSEAYRKTEQQRVDAFYKRMNPVVKGVLDVGTSLLRTPTRAVGDVTSGLVRATAGAIEFVTPENTLPGLTTGLNTTADLLTSVSQGLNNNMFPQPSNLEVAMLDVYAPYRGYRVYTNSRGEVIDVRDGDGYRLAEDEAGAIIKRYEADPRKPEKVYDPNMHTVLPKLTQTMADLYLLLQAPGVGATVKMGAEASVVTYGYLQTYNSAYNEIKEADPFMSEEGAHLYANIKGLMNGEIWSLTPRALFKNVDKDLFFQDLGKEYTKILAGGATAKKAMSMALSKTVLKNGLGEAAVELGIDLGDKALKLATNTITNRPTQEVEYSVSDFVETGLLSFAAGGIFSRLNNNKDNMTRDALYAGMKNFDGTVQQMEQMANMGQITQQQYNNAIGIMSRLKPVYDNLNDQTKYNDAYKANILSLYADKLNIEDKINVSESYMVGEDPQRDLLMRQLGEIDQKIKMVTMVSAPDYVWTDGLGNEKKVTRAEVLEFMKDPIWLGLLKNGSYKLDVYNDQEIESLVNKYVPKEERVEVEPEVETPSTEAEGEPEVKVPTPTEEKAPEPVKPIMVVDALGKKVKTKDGLTGFLEQTESGIYFTDEQGNSRQLPVADKTNPTESLEELGLVIVQPKVRIPPPVSVELLDDNVSFNIGGEKLTWLKFNYGNNGELQTADMMRPDGSKVKLKDRDVVYDMAVQLSNSSRAKLSVPNERASADISEAVQPIREMFDVGMRAIDTIYGDVDPSVETVLEAIEMGAEVDPDVHAAAELWLEDAIKRTEKIETQNVEEKQRVLEWAKGILREVSTAKLAPKRQVQPEPTAEGAGRKPVAEGKPVTPTEQRVYEFPELPSRAKALVKRLAGGKGEAEAERIVTTIKEAYQAEKAPKEALAKIGYEKQEYEKAIGEIVEALKPTVKTVPVEVKPTVPTVAKAKLQAIGALPAPIGKQELVGMIQDGTAKDMIETGSLDMLQFMRMVDKFELPMPKWFQSMQETVAEEMGYTTEAEDAELLDLINKAYERTGVPELKAEPEVPTTMELPEPEVPAEYRYTTEQTKIANDIKELDTIIRAKAIDGRKLSNEEIETYKAKRDGQKIRLELLLDENSNENLAVEEQLRRVKIKVTGVEETAKAAAEFWEKTVLKKEKQDSNSRTLFVTLGRLLGATSVAEKPTESPALTVGKARKPFRFQYVRNPEKAPNMGSTFGQDVEPAGIYVNQISNDFVPPGWQTGIADLKSPLEIEVNQNNLVEWKRELSAAYDGKTGQELTEALINDGFDGIVTRYDNGDTGEVIIFSKAALSFVATDETTEVVVPEVVKPGIDKKTIDTYRKTYLKQAGFYRDAALSKRNLGEIPKTKLITEGIPSGQATDEQVFQNNLRALVSLIKVKILDSSEATYQELATALVNTRRKDLSYLWVDKDGNSVEPNRITVATAGGTVFLDYAFAKIKPAAKEQKVLDIVKGFGLSLSNLETVGAKMIGEAKQLKGAPQYIEGNPVAGTAEVGDYRPEFMGKVIETGKETTIILPNGERIPAKYALVKLGDVIPSHDPFAFIKSKGYPVDTQGRTTNDRDYESDPASQATTIKFGLNPDNDKFLDLTKSPATGPSIVTFDGFVVGGNGRVMAMNRMSAANGVRYNTDLYQQASDFGFTSVPTYSSKQPISELPIVVRIAETTDQYSKTNSKKYNQAEFKEASQEDIAIAFGEFLNKSENNRVKEILFNEIGEFDTMAEFFADKTSAKKIKLLLTDTIVEQKDINKYFDAQGRWTTTGKEVFRQGVFATLFNEDIVRITNTPGVTAFIDKIGKSLPAVALNFNLPSDKNLKKELEDAIRFQSEFASSGIPDVVDFIRQGSLFEKPSLESALMWSLISSSTAKNNIFRKALDSYNNSVQSDMTASLFEEEVARTKDEFFILITKNIPENERKAIQSSLAFEGFGPKGPGTVSEAFKGYSRKGRGRGVIRYTSDAQVANESKVGQSKPGEIDRKSLIDFIKAHGINEDGVAFVKLGENYGSLLYDLSQIPGNIEMYRIMSEPGKPIKSNVFRFKIDGVPFNPYQYIKTGNPVGKVREDVNQLQFNRQVQEATNVGFSQDQINYRQSQIDFANNPDTRSADVRGENPVLYRSVLEAQAQEIMGDGRKASTALAETKMRRKLEKGEYVAKTSKISIDKTWNVLTDRPYIKSPADVAYMMRMMETFNTEHSAVVMLDGDGNKVAAHISVGTIVSAEVPFNGIFDMLNSFGATEFYFVHNHPSGTMRPSDNDIEITKMMQGYATQAGIDFKGSVIVDWDKSVYSFINNEGNIGAAGRTYMDQPASGRAMQEVPLYNNWSDVLNERVPDVKMPDYKAWSVYASGTIAQMRAGDAPKGGVLLLNNAARVVGNFFLNGENDVQTIVRAVAATNAAAIVTYGTFDKPVLELDTNVLDAVVLDHVHVQSGNVAQYDLNAKVPPVDVVAPSAINIPRVHELSFPFNEKSSKLEQQVQKAMLDGFITFDEVIFNLYTNYYNGDAGKIRKALQTIKDAYDEVSLLDEFIDSAISSIDEVARFDLDRFLITVNRPQKTENSLRQQYNDFATWFEYNYPQAKFYYSIALDPATGQAYFKIGNDPLYIDGTNKILYYGDWLGNTATQKKWNQVKQSGAIDKPPMTWVDKDVTPVPFEHVKPNQYAIGEDQEVAVNLILDRFIPKTPGKEPKRGFMLGDGMGIGKTRIALVSANEMLKAKNLPVLIITKGAQVVDGFQREAGALSMRNVVFRQEPKNVNEAKIVVGTYEDLTTGKLGNADRYGVVIFDEAHNLKNKGTQRSKSAEEFLQKTDHVVFATGTPMDKPVQLAYFIQHLSGKDIDTTLSDVGLELDKGRLKVKKGSKIKNYKELFLKWRESMIREGGYIRREYPFYGTAGAVSIQVPENALAMLERIKRGNGRRTAIMAANRYQEHLKVPYIFQETLKALEDGKQVVVFCVGVNDTVIWPDGKPKEDEEGYSIEVPQFAKAFSERLRNAGIPHAKIYGPDAQVKLEESRKFQRGEVKVVIATISSGGTGIDLDDQIGDAPREVLYATLPWSGNEFDQSQFRVSRRNTKTPSRLRPVFIDGSWVDEHKKDLVDEKMVTLSLIQRGADPDLLAIERWRENADGSLIDIVEDDINDLDENVSDPEPDQYVQALPTEVEITETPSEVIEKFEKGDTETLQAAGVLPAPIGGSAQYIKITPENKVEPEKEGKIEPTVSVGDASTKGSAVSLGGAKSTPTIPQRRSWWKSFLFGPAKQKSLSTMVLEIYKELGIPTTGQTHMRKKYLGYYEHLTKDVKLKIPADIFTALHEAIHWADFSKLGGITYQIIKDNDTGLIRQLSDIYDDFYPGAKDSTPVRTKVSEGITMYMEMKLYDPQLISGYSDVESKIFTPGGKYYGKAWDDVYNAFDKLKNDIAAMSPIMRAGLRIADMNTPKSSEYTISTWNFLAKRLFKNYDESIPLSLWDDKAGVGFGTMMERIEGATNRLIQSAQNAYFFYRNRNKLASNWIASEPTLLSGLLPSNPVYYDTNGRWTPSEYRMEDMINLLKKIEKSNPEILTSETWINLKVNPNDTIDITKAYSQYLMMRRVFMDYQKRTDLELEIKQIFLDGQQMYEDLLAETDPDIHRDMLADFNSKYVRPLKLALARWNKVNDVIGNEGGTYVTLNKDFQPNILGWSSPAFQDLHSTVYNPNLGNIVSEAEATQVYTTFNDTFADVDEIFDGINQTMLQMMVATGMLSPAAKNKYVQDHLRYPGYASFQRHVANTFFNDPELERTIGSDNVGKIKSTLQRKGSMQDIIDPILSQAVMIHEVFRKGLKNLMWLRLANMSRTDEELARGLQPTPTVYIPEKTKSGETLYNKMQIAGKVDIPGQVLIYANGVGRYWQIADESLLSFYNALTELDGGGFWNGIVQSRVFKAFTGAANLFTLMTTGIYPYWAIQNFTVDQLSSFMNSKLGTIPLVTSAKNFLPAFGLAIGNTVGTQLQAFDVFQKMFPGQKPTPKQLEYIVEFMSIGGSSQTMTSQLLSDEQKATVQDLFEVVPKGLIPKLKFGAKRIPKVVTWTVDLTSLPTNISEIIPRFSEYAEARKRGMSMEAAFRYSMETMPFSKRGASQVSRIYYPTVSYLRSSITVAAKTLEEAIDQPKKFALVWGGMASATALAFLNFWNDLEEDEKNYYLQADGTELSQYLVIPARYMGGPANTMYRFRIPEIIGSAVGMGVLYASAISTNQSPEIKQIAKAATSVLPPIFNPMEYMYGDTGVAASVTRQVYRFTPQLARPAYGLIAGKTPTSSGMRPITPRSLEFYPGEFQYRIGTGGTPSVVNDIYQNVTKNIGLSPIQTEYLINEYTGRTGRFVLDYIDDKEIKSTFIRKREDYALRGRWYQRFYEKNANIRGEFTVLNTIRDPKPSETDIALYQQWEKKVFDIAREYTIYQATDKLLSEAYKVQEHAKIYDTNLPLNVYDKFDAMAKSFYDNQNYETRKNKLEDAYSALKDAAVGVGYENVDFFAMPIYTVKLMDEIDKSYNKIYKQ